MQPLLRLATLIVLSTALETHAVPGSSLQGAIVGGARSAGDPSVVGIQTGERLFCSGVLLAPRVVVTAAHCVALTRNLGVFVGTSPAEVGEVIPVSQVEVHPAYVPATSENDIALLRLSRDAPHAPWPAVASLDESAEGRTVRLVGFGKISRDDEGPPAKHTGTAIISALDDTRLALSAGPSVPCFRDSGGAILISEGDAVFLVGIIASGSTACDPDSPSHGTRTDVFLEDFIASAVAAEVPKEGCAASANPRSSPSGLAGLLLLILAMWGHRRHQRWVLHLHRQP